MYDLLILLTHHFTDEETETEMLSTLLEVLQLVVIKICPHLYYRASAHNHSTANASPRKASKLK